MYCQKLNLMENIYSIKGQALILKLPDRHDKKIQKKINIITALMSGSIHYAFRFFFCYQHEDYAQGVSY